MNVSVVTREGETLKQVLILNKDVAAGEVIYKVDLARYGAPFLD